MKIGGRDHLTSVLYSSFRMEVYPHLPCSLTPVTVRVSLRVTGSPLDPLWDRANMNLSPSRLVPAGVRWFRFRNEN